jgi:hypothetical protein
MLYIVSGTPPPQALIAKNKAAGEPDDDATEQIGVATECVTLAKHLQVMMDKSPDLVEVRACLLLCFRFVHPPRMHRLGWAQCD